MTKGKHFSAQTSARFLIIYGKKHSCNSISGDNSLFVSQRIMLRNELRLFHLAISQREIIRAGCQMNFMKLHKYYICIGEKKRCKIFLFQLYTALIFNEFTLKEVSHKDSSTVSIEFTEGELIALLLKFRVVNQILQCNQLDG
ncbi:hypothetical protein D917_06302 [Trichinella nativa]|uniref:Uncharacterized protein n=1 Tax=Trichinella nativa TaxID=6335 RepID=A0A1Y3EYU7_9BILA|nr:hypothetical protein D917_06302 [Trichinella nativa]